ncbi:MAG: DUF4418 family protein [Eubacteriales bacterium]|nr:DUF4418 family protein [Eubacteriales bacterium]
MRKNVKQSFVKALILWIYAAIGLFSFAWIYFWHPVCKTEPAQLWASSNAMHPCLLGGRWVSSLSLVCTVIALIMLFYRHGIVRYILAVVAAVLNVVAILLPTQFGLICKAPQMRCRTETFPTTNILHTVGVILILIWLIWSLIEAQQVRVAVENQRRA